MSDKLTPEQISQLTNAICECGGKGPEDDGVCEACVLYHHIAALEAEIGATKALLREARALLDMSDISPGMFIGSSDEYEGAIAKKHAWLKEARAAPGVISGEADNA